MTAIAQLTASALILACAFASASCAPGDFGSDPDATPQQSTLPTPSEETASPSESTTTPDSNTPSPTETDEDDDDDGPSFFEKIAEIIPSDIRCTDVNTMQLGQAYDVQVDRLATELICLPNPGWKAPLRPPIRVTLLDGSYQTVYPLPADNDLWRWRFTPGFDSQPVSQTGTYEFAVMAPPPTHGGATPTIAPTDATSPTSSTTETALELAYFGQITVQDPESPQLVATPFVQVGGTVAVALAGYPPDSNLQVVAYGPAEPSGPGFSSYARLGPLPAATADAQGEARMMWPVPPGTSPGRYGLWVDPLPQGCLRLCVVVTVS